MAANKIVTLGPVALTTTLTTNVFGPPSLTLSGGANNPPPATTWISYYIIRYVRILNKTASAATFSLYKDASGGNTAGKEYLGTAYSVAPNSAFEAFPMTRIQSDETDKFIVGGAGTATALVIMAIAEVGIV